MNEKISVVIPVYNAEYTIERCICSILENTYTNIEILIIEDCSQDASWSLCQSLDRKYTNIRIFRNHKNMGVSYSRNIGIKNAKGDFVVFIDSDDWISKDYFKNLLENQEEGVFPICGYLNHDEFFGAGTSYIGWDTENSLSEKIDFKSELIHVYEKRLLQQLWNKIFDLSIICKNNIKFDEKINMGEDFKFILEYLKCLKPNKFLVVNSGLYHYMRENPNSLMMNTDYFRLEENMKNMAIMYEIQGKNESDIEAILVKEREKQLYQQGYFILNRKDLSDKEKKKKIKMLDPILGKKIYCDLKRNSVKEQFTSVIKKVKIEKW